MKKDFRKFNVRLAILVIVSILISCKGGMRFLQSSSISFRMMGYYGQWWSIDKTNDKNYYARNMASLFNDVIRNTGHNTEGQSVRCVKD